MVHNQVPEFIEQLKQYAATIWPFFAESKTGVDIGDVILFVADYPNTNYLERLVEYTDTLRAVVSVTDQGVITKRSLQFAEARKEIQIRVSLEIMTADPTLRDRMGGMLYEFIDKNPTYFGGVESNWQITDIDSEGTTAAPASLFGRSYTVYLVEFS